MSRELDAGSLVELWTLPGDELNCAGGKRDANALAFALLLMFFGVHGRFPRGRAELPDEAVKFVCRGRCVPIAFYAKNIERHGECDGWAPGIVQARQGERRVRTKAPSVCPHGARGVR